MNALLLLADAGGGGQVEQIARTFGVDWPHLIAQIISFAIVCAVLYRFAYRRVLAILQDRRQQIAQGLANAEQIKAELARTEAQRQAVIGEANAQATRLIDEARSAAASVQREETQKALAAAAQIVARAQEATVQDHARMLAELKREVGRLVVETTAAVAGRILTPEDQRRLDEETVRRLGPAQSDGETRKEMLG
jgi:F-type H+-transporting ATPase subunit b